MKTYKNINQKGGRAGRLQRDARKRAQVLISGPAYPLPPPDPKDLEIPKKRRRTLLQLEWNRCRYPIGDPGVDLFFCGAIKKPNSPYCARHLAIVWRPARRAY